MATANGLWPWMTPTGVLVVGGPDYSSAPVDRLVLRHDGRGNNVQRLSVRRSIANRYSQVTVLGQHGQYDNDGWDTSRSHIISTVQDQALTRRGIFRPQVIVDSASETQDLTTRRARKVLADSRLEGFEIRAIVAGHRTTSGQVWEPASGSRSTASRMAWTAPTSSCPAPCARRAARAPSPNCTCAKTTPGSWTATPARRGASARVTPTPSSSPESGAIDDHSAEARPRTDQPRATQCAPGPAWRPTSLNTAWPNIGLEVEGLAGEQVATELVQHYGFTSAPLPGAEMIVLPIGGRTNHSVVVAIEDGRYRVQVVDGEVCLYTDEGDYIHRARPPDRGQHCGPADQRGQLRGDQHHRLPPERQRQRPTPPNSTIWPQAPR
ncbi:phage baseplate assembly protein [Pseudomonas aeruginosa]|nr:phage baseplate assembly protein [Pseudomonas aeruginosa]